MPNIVEANELVKQYPGSPEPAVRGVSFTIQQGEIFGFLGPNGAGKTTSISMLSCLLKPTGGSATVAGFDIIRQSAEVKRRIGLVPQDLALPGAAQEILDKLEQKSIGVDILVNNAGFVVYGNFYETDLAKELQMIQVNLVAMTELCKLVLGGMRKRGYGRILNLGSTGSFVPSPLNAVYSATKAYLNMFAEGLQAVHALWSGADWRRLHLDGGRFSDSVERVGG